MTALIGCQRHLFDIPDDVAYLNTAYISPLMRRVREAGERGVRRKSRPWEIFPPDFFNEAETARGLFARLVNASADDVAIIPAASYGLSLAAANLSLAPGQSVVVTGDQFPSNVYPWRELAGRHDGRIVTVPRPEDERWSDALIAAIDETTGIVACGNCHWTNGALFDLVAIGRRCREVGAALVLDLTQSLGALPFDVAEVDPDFAVAATYKWLLGPYCLGFCYVAPRHQQGRPLEHNWIHRRNAEDFANLVDYQDGFQDGARRFDVGERGNFHLVPMALAALEQLIDWGPDSIQMTLRVRTEAIAREAEGLGLGAAPVELRAGHFLGLRFPAARYPGGIPGGLMEKLVAERVFVSVRGRDSMRITPHLWVNDEDVSRLFQVLKKVL